MANDQWIQTGLVWDFPAVEQFTTVLSEHEGFHSTMTLQLQSRAAVEGVRGDGEGAPNCTNVDDGMSYAQEKETAECDFVLFFSPSEPLGTEVE